MAYQVNGSRVEWNPAAARLRELAGEMPDASASVTEFGNVNVKARADSRRTRSTCLVEDSANSTGQAITRAEVAHGRRGRLYRLGSAVPHRARLIMEAANASAAVAGLIRAMPEGTSAVDPSVLIVGYVCGRSSR